MIHVLATIDLRPQTRERFLEEFRGILDEVRAEPGCIEYGAAVDLPTSLPAQPTERPDVAVIVEKWADVEALRAHLTAPHMNAYRERVKPYVTRSTLHVLEPA
jgi:quinol monooxygenase YgiN